MSDLSVASFLGVLGLSELETTFSENEIDEGSLSSLDRSDLEEMEIDASHHDRLMWGVDNVPALHAWLGELELGQYLGNFVENEVGMAQVGSLDKDDLKEMGVSVLGHRKKILGAAAPSPAPAPAPVAAPRSSNEDNVEAVMDEGALAGLKVEESDRQNALKVQIQREDIAAVIGALPDGVGPGASFSGTLVELNAKVDAYTAVHSEYAELVTQLEAARETFRLGGKTVAPTADKEEPASPLGMFGMPNMAQMQNMANQAQKANEVDTSGHPLGHHAKSLGQAVLAAITAGDCSPGTDVQDALTVARTANESVVKLEAESAALDNVTGFLAMAKAKASQLMLQGQILTAKADFEKAAVSLGLRILNVGSEESYRCAGTEGILAQIAQERDGLAHLQGGVDQAQAAIDGRMDDWKQRTGLSAIPSLDHLEGERERLVSERDALVDQALAGLVESCRSGLLGSDFVLFAALDELGRLQLQIKKSDAIISKMNQQMERMGGIGAPTKKDPMWETYGDIIKRKDTPAGGDAGLAGSWGFDKRTDEEKAELAKGRFELLAKTNMNMLMTIVRHNVGKKLKSQSTAVWPNLDKFYIEKCWSVHSDGILKVIGTVEAQNGFGAMGALNFSTGFYIAEVDGEGEGQSAKWNTTTTSVTEVGKWIGRYS